MSGQGWYDADGRPRSSPQPKQAAPVTPEPSGWYDADGNFHEGLPPGLAAKRAEEERLAAEAAASRAGGEGRGSRPRPLPALRAGTTLMATTMRGSRRGLRSLLPMRTRFLQYRRSLSAQPQVVVVQPAAVAPAAPILVAAPQRASSGAKAALRGVEPLGARRFARGVGDGLARHLQPRHARPWRHRPAAAAPVQQLEPRAGRSGRLLVLARQAGERDERDAARGAREGGLRAGLDRTSDDDGGRSERRPCRQLRCDQSIM